MFIEEPEHIRMMRESIRRFLDDEAPRSLVAEWDRLDRIPKHFFERLADLGLGTLTVPEEYGGMGPDCLATIVAIEELARRSIAIASGYIMNACYGGMNITESGSPEQKAKLLPSLAAGRMMFAYGLSEPDVGADLASVKTRARLENGRVILNGTKRWCTGADIADYIYCLVRSGEPDARYRNLSFILVPTNAPGISMTHSPTMGLCGLATNDVTFEDVELGPESIVGGPDAWNKGWTQLVSAALEIEKVEVAAMALGLATQALEDAWSYAGEREQFGKKIAAIQSVRHQLANSSTKLLACRLMVYHAAGLCQSGRPSPAETSMTKNFVCETAVEIVLECQKVMGAYGYSKEFAMERYVRDVLVMPIFGGSTAIHNNNIANRLALGA
jgi:alkylation response protein AidB-like acyl-CoA dehydrogenase